MLAFLCTIISHIESKALEAAMNPLYAENLSVEELRTILGTKGNNTQLLEKHEQKDLSPILYHAQKGRWDLVNVMADQKLNKEQGKKAQFGEAMLLCMQEITTLSTEQRPFMIALAKKLLENGASPKVSGEYGENIMHLAITIGDKELFDAVLKSRVDLRQTLNNLSPLYQAVMSNKWDFALAIARKINIKFVIDERECNKIIELAGNAGQTELVKIVKKIRKNNTWEHIEPVTLQNMIDKDKRNIKQCINDDLSPMQKVIKAGRWELMDQFVDDTPVLEWFALNIGGKSPLILAAENGKWGLIDELVDKINSTKFNIYENLDHMKQLKQVENLLNNDKAISLDDKGKIGNKLQRLDSFADQFKKVYAALYESQSSVMKTGEKWHKSDKPLNIEYILEYAKKHPTSRTKKAVELTFAYLKNPHEQALIKEIHKYSFKHSSSFGFFKRKPNEEKLNKELIDAEELDKNSRTGKIVTELRKK